MQPGTVLLSKGLTLPDGVIARLPDLITSIGFSLAGAGQFGLGGTNQRSGVLTGLVSFRPRGLGGPRSFRDPLLSVNVGGLNLGVSAGNRLGQLPASLPGCLTRPAGLGLGGLPAVTRGPRRLPCRKQLLPGLSGLRLGGDRTRLGATPGRFGVGQLHRHRFRIQRRGLPTGQRDQRSGLPDQRLQRGDRVAGLL